MPRLPVELLLEILQCCLDDTPIDEHAQQLLCLQHVCAAWYNAVENCPFLWTTIYLASQDPRYVMKALERSRDALLWVETDAKYEADEVDADLQDSEEVIWWYPVREQAGALVRILEAEIHRIRVLVVENWQVQDLVRDHLCATLNAPALEVLRLPAAIPSDCVWFSILVSAPKLRELEVGGFDDLQGWTSLAFAPLDSLRKLALGSDYHGEIFPRLADLLDLLHFTPRLEELTLSKLDSEEEWTAADDTVVLHKLCRLRIDECGIVKALLLLRSLVLAPGCTIHHIEHPSTRDRHQLFDYPRQASAALDVATGVATVLQGTEELYFSLERRKNCFVVRISDEDPSFDLSDNDASSVRLELPPHPDFVRDFCLRLPLSRVAVLSLGAVCRCEAWRYTHAPTFSKADEVRALQEICAMMPNMRKLHLESTFCDCVTAAYVSLVAAAPPELTTLRIVVDAGYDLHRERHSRFFVEDLVYALRQRELDGYPVYYLSAQSKHREDRLDREILDGWARRGDGGRSHDMDLDNAGMWGCGDIAWHDVMDCS